jgi:putative transposase
LATPIAHSYIYLIAILDWFYRRILSWRLRITLNADFCAEV